MLKGKLVSFIQKIYVQQLNLGLMSTQVSILLLDKETVIWRGKVSWSLLPPQFSSRCLRTRATHIARLADTSPEPKPNAGKTFHEPAHGSLWCWRKAQAQVYGPPESQPPVLQSRLFYDPWASLKSFGLLLVLHSLSCNYRASWVRNWHPWLDEAKFLP